ncbi:hypothetical protein NP284_19845 [Rhodopseudomonas pseudopalustris]|uniref:hypothetical protein n=1 Tax=Rhodopseudomonas pseudopalustris TaxID=1513892 RepID=UPI003F9BCCA8
MRHTTHPLLAITAAALLSVPLPRAATAQPTPAAFDGFLAGLTECQFSPDFQKFRSGVIERFANPAFSKQPIANKSAVVPLPAALSGTIDIEGARLRSDDDGESTTVDIPVTGTYGGLPLKNLLFVLGNENGIAIAGAEFAAPRDQVVKTFGPAIKRGTAQLKKTADEFPMSVGFGKPPAASIYCDQSN